MSDNASAAVARPFPIPTSYFSMVIGTAALAISWRNGHVSGLLPAWPGMAMGWLAGVVWVLLMGAFGVKLARYYSQFRAEVEHPILCCFISTVPMTTMLIGMVLLPELRPVGAALIVIGTVGQLLFAMWRSAGLWRGLHVFQATTPVLMLPTLGTNFVSATAIASMGMPELATLFLGAGVMSWVVLEPPILSRLRTEPALDPKLRGVIGILLAPAFVCCNAYLQINGGHIDMIVLLLVGYGLLQLLFLLRLLPWVLEAGFTMSVWGFSFGLAAMTGTGLRLAASDHALSGLGQGIWMGASLAMLVLIGATLWLIARGRFLVRA